MAVLVGLVVSIICIIIPYLIGCIVARNEAGAERWLAGFTILMVIPALIAMFYIIGKIIFILI